VPRTSEVPGTLKPVYFLDTPGAKEWFDKKWGINYSLDWTEDAMQRLEIIKGDQKPSVRGRAESIYFFE
jgi:hypothetical protein